MPHSHPEDLLTLASEAPSPAARRELLQQCGEMLTALGRVAQAERILREEIKAAGADEQARIESELERLRKKAGEPRQAPFNRIAISSGHMIDAPDRKSPRFPAAKAETVRAGIARQLETWGIDVGDLAICGGASGGDILFAEECLKRGVQLRLLLSQTVAEFVRDSVQPAGRDWVHRFHALREHAEVAIQPERLGQPPDGVSIYARTNLWMINSARIEASNSAKIHALLVWDQKPTGDGPGGTSDFESRVRGLGGAIAIVNPTVLP